MGWFIDPFALPAGTDGDMQLLFLLFAYAYMLYVGSNYISSGSELLLLIPELKFIVGSAILPVIGAVPDGALVYFSADGDDPQSEVAVGVGALAGSTIMLLTIPMLISAYYGRVKISNGRAVYANPFKKILKHWPSDDDHERLVDLGVKFNTIRTAVPRPQTVSPDVIAATKRIIEAHAKGWKKLDAASSCSETGISVSSTVRFNFMILVATGLTYVGIQSGAYYASERSRVARLNFMRSLSLVGCFVCVVFFIWYLIDQYNNANRLRKFILDKRIMAIENGDVRLKDVFLRLVHANDKGGVFKDFCDHIKPFFKKYDKNQSGNLSEAEVAVLLSDLGEEDMDVHNFFLEFDKDSDDTISEIEFYEAMFDYIKRKEPEVTVARRVLAGDKDLVLSVLERGHGKDIPLLRVQGSMHTWVENFNAQKNSPTKDGATKTDSDASDNIDDDEEDEEEMPEDLIKLTDKQKRRALLQRSFFMMGGGLALIMLFSDAICDVFSAVGERAGIPPFYIAFVLGPIASNASEMIASKAYAARKTKMTTSSSLSALAGAGIMNNTFCTAIFLYLIASKHLVWEFSAETMGILFVEIAVALVLSTRSVLRMREAVGIFCLYPLSLALIWALENYFGFS